MIEVNSNKISFSPTVLRTVHTAHLIPTSLSEDEEKEARKNIGKS